MSQEGVERFLGRLLTDRRLLQLGLRSLAEACRETGFDLSEGELAAIRREDLLRMKSLAERLDSRIQRYRCPVGEG
ncbi:hypothetical protein FO488_04960 [Geobacter sp. FeAm09]|uniref:Os1348 family NHLP clan protein n=1 Tax=Geobacter sp. FeAm09 TaxID=2597769 RepID=UPI0011EC9210|nr:Os1348 family NHLP clan protein [Geobacter sp. FeAm09]QEM67563.1 hypothetical protein FO488_04960 [Geobacter sp. FeAm09]